MADLVSVTRHEGIAVVTLNNPPVNALSHAVRVALLATLKELSSSASCEALVIACEGRTFIAGADIREFGKPPLAPDLPELVEYVDAAPWPTIAAIHGTALGGGLELALACDFRLATACAKLGLPEVTLGILPGAGGTQRLPRLVGVPTALELIVSGSPISAAEAKRIGLVDEIIADEVKESALAFARRKLSEPRPRRRVSSLPATLDDPRLFETYEKRIADRYRGFRAPFRCIDAVRAAVELPFCDGLARERALFRELIASRESRAQRHIFFGEREVGKVPGLPEDTPTRPVRSVAVFGRTAEVAGLARCFADARIPVTLLADDPDELDRSLATIRAGYQRVVERGRMSQQESDARLELVRRARTFEEARGADLLIEAVGEDLGAKRAALARLDLVASPSAILVSTTSLCSLDEIAAATSRPADVVGMQFASPIEHAKLLENARGIRTQADVYATSMKLGRTLGKLSVPVRGPVARRLFAARAREALLLLEEGALPQEIDLALTEFGFRMGPFAALDLAGIDAALAERRTNDAELTPRERACTILEQLAELGRFGSRAGAGFYRHEGAELTPDPAVVALLERHSSGLGLPRRSVSADEIRERCLLRVINAAARLLEAEVAARALDIDVICVHGEGFPVYRGGPLFYAHELGLQHVHQRLLARREQVGEESFTPAPLIARLLADGKSFYGAP